MTRERRNSSRTSSGVASVAMSKSLGLRPSSRSRTAPPTTKAANPWRCSVWVVRSAHELIASRPMPCAPNGMIFGCAGLNSRPGEHLAEEMVITWFNPSIQASSSIQRELQSCALGLDYSKFTS